MISNTQSQTPSDVPLLPTLLDSSSLTSLLSTNDPPSLVEEDAILHLIADAEHDIALVDAEFSRLQTALNRLPRRRRELKSFTENHQRLLSPIRRLPREIISEIVLQALHRYTDDPTAATLDTKTDPWAFGQVCRIWRDVVTNLSSLWSILYIDPEECTQHSGDIIITLLNRSKNTPIFLVFEDLSFPASPASELCLDLILGSCRRWDHVEFYIDVQRLAKLNVVKGNLPCLSNLTLWTGRDPEMDETFDVVDGFEAAPKLRRVDLHLAAQLDLPLPVEQLTRYHERQCALWDTAHDYRRLYNVTDCCIALEDAPDSTDSIITPHCLPHVERLKADTGILPHFTLPALRQFEEEYWVSGHLPRLASLLQRSCCMLDTLLLNRLYGAEHSVQLAEVLRLTPALTSLSIAWSPCNEDVLSLLTLQPTSDQLLVPKLEFLTIRCTVSDPGEAAFDSRTLLDMAESRWNIQPRRDIVRLKTFQFGVDRWKQTQFLSPESAKRCAILVDCGMRIYLKASDDYLPSMWQKYATLP